MIGILDKELSEKLQLTPDLTLEKAVETARQLEMVKSQIKDQSVSATNVEAVRKHCTTGQSPQSNNSRGRGRGRGHRYTHSRGRGNHHRRQGQGKYNK